MSKYYLFPRPRTSTERHLYILASDTSLLLIICPNQRDTLSTSHHMPPPEGLSLILITCPNQRDTLSNSHHMPQPAEHSIVESAPYCFPFQPFYTLFHSSLPPHLSTFHFQHIQSYFTEFFIHTGVHTTLHTTVSEQLFFHADTSLQPSPKAGNINVLLGSYCLTNRECYLPLYA